MWTRKELKDRAKQVLKTSYWKAFLVSLLLALLTGGLPSCSSSSGMGGGGSSGGVSWQGVTDQFDEVGTGAWIVIFAIILVVIVLVALISIAIRILLISPLEVGARKYFVQSAQGEVNLNHLGYSFNRGKYGAIVKTMLWKLFLNFLWFLLLIVPGIIKTYSYSLVPYILADNPTIGAKRAVELSRRMARGHKWRMFVLDLSFIGWFLLGTLALVIGTLFVLPYYNATKAELYLVLREDALRQGHSSPDELNLNLV